MSAHTLGWRVEIREEGGRLLGWAVHAAGAETQLWEVATCDGRRTAVGTRAEALLALAAMCDAVPLADPPQQPEGGEPGGDDAG